MLTVGQLNAKITPKLHGASLKKVANMYGKYHEAASTLLGRIDPYDTVQRQRIDNAIYDKIYNYTAPTDIKGLNNIVDMRPIGPRSTRDDVMETFGREFDIKKEINNMTIEVIAGVKTLRISKCIDPSTLLCDLDAVDSTITIGGDVTSPVSDYLDFISGNASYSFGLSGVTGIGTITINLPQSFDLSKMENLGALFLWLKFSDATRFTSIDLEWGSGSSAYWHKTVTAPQGRTTVDTNAWDLMPFQWVSATKVGAPVSSTTNYLKITLNYTTGAALSFCKIDSITAALGKAYELLYYSQNIFRDATTGVLKEIPTADSDIIQLDPMSTNILMYELMKILAAEIKGRNMGTDIQKYVYELEGDGRIIRGTLVANRAGLYRDYVSRYPSQAVPQQSEYYEFDSLDGS